MSNIFRGPNRRAESTPSGGTAAVLVALIGVILILYIVFLPEDTREELLGDSDAGGTAKDGQIGLSVLLEERPGTLEYMRDNRITHNIPSMVIYAYTNAVILFEKESAYVKSSFFGKKRLTIRFNLDDVENTDNVFISGNLKERSGRIIINLNGEEVFNSFIATPNVNPIRMPKELLQEINELEISVSGVGPAFWSVNEYQIENLKLTAEIKDVKAQEGINVFLVSNTESVNVERTYLRFMANCDLSNVGKLLVQINGNEIMNQVPDCGLRTVQAFSPHYLRPGENKVRFYTDKGIYSIDSISVESELREISNPVYYFELNTENYEKVMSGDREVLIEMKFIEDIEDKKADIIVNGRWIRLDTRERDFVEDISSFVEKGSNGIRIIPLSTMHITSLRVVIG